MTRLLLPAIAGAAVIAVALLCLLAEPAPHTEADPPPRVFAPVASRSMDRYRGPLPTTTTNRPTIVTNALPRVPRYRGEPGPEQWAALRRCESNGRYDNKDNPAFRGAYQAAWSTWGGYAGYRDPADAPPAVQDEWARELYAQRGAQPWPVCGRWLVNYRGRIG